MQARAYDTSGNTKDSVTSTVTINNHEPTLVVSGPASQTFRAGSTQTWTFSAAVAGGGAAIDATPPDTSLTAGPPDGAVLRSRSVMFGLATGDPGAALGCRLYRQGTTAPEFAPCTTATSFSGTGLDDGSYVFQGRAVDAVGNPDETPVLRTFTVDATPPSLSVAKAPKRVVKTRKKKAKVSFAFSSQDGTTFRCSLDGAAYSACPAALSLKVKVGKHTLSVQAVDAAGNVSPTRAISWKVKRTKKHH